jgi:hypothetical protein
MYRQGSGIMKLLSLIATAVALSATTGTAAAAQGIGPTKTVHLVFINLDKVDVQLWIDGKRVVARHMTVSDWSTALSFAVDAPVRRHSRIVLAIGDKRQQATIASIAELKTIYLDRVPPITMSKDQPALD